MTIHFVTEREKKALEALEAAIGSGIFSCNRVGVGQVVLKMPEKYRKHLRELRSDDVKNLRLWWGNDE